MKFILHFLVLTGKFCKYDLTIKVGSRGDADETVIA